MGTSRNCMPGSANESALCSSARKAEPSGHNSRDPPRAAGCRLLVARVSHADAAGLAKQLARTVAESLIKPAKSSESTAPQTQKEAFSGSG
jgi:hypothetical protein